MEEIENKTQEEENQRWVTILLIIGNIIIWTIIIFVIGLVKVNAAPTTYQLDAWSVGHSGQDSGALTNNQTYSWAWPKAVYDSAYINIVFTARNGTTTAHARVETNFPNFCLFSTYVWEGNVKMNLTVTRQCSGTNNNIVDYYFQMVSHQGQNITLQLKPIAPLTLMTSMSITATVSGSQDVELSNDLTNDTFINATNNQTTTIVNNITENVNNLKEGFINAITDNNTTCNTYNYNNDFPLDTNESGKKLTTTGATQTVNGYNITDYIKINANRNYSYTTSNTASNNTYCIYNEEKTLISCANATVNGTTTINSTQEGYIRLSIRTNYTNQLKGKICMTNTEATINAIEEFKQLFNVEPWEDIEPDSTYYDETHEMEDEILDMAEDIDLTNVNLEIDTESSNWVWTTLTALINTNSLVFGMVISILSVGIIKLLLNR